jgi:hypothetical protein
MSNINNDTTGLVVHFTEDSGIDFKAVALEARSDGPVLVVNSRAMNPAGETVRAGTIDRGIVGIDNTWTYVIVQAGQHYDELVTPLLEAAGEGASLDKPAVFRRVLDVLRDAGLQVFLLNAESGVTVVRPSVR